MLSNGIKIHLAISFIKKNGNSLVGDKEYKIPPTIHVASFEQISKEILLKNIITSYMWKKISEK